jgi:hypothetical protein
MDWSRVARWLPILGALLPLLFFLSPHTVSYDDHLTPCQLILESGALPAPEACWECHQPPLFYLLGAGFLGAARALAGGLPASTAFTALKLLNLLLTLGTIVLLAALLRRSFPTRPGVQAAALLLALVTPNFVLSGVFVGNDSAVLLLSTLTLWLAADAPPGRAGLVRAGAVGLAAGAAVLAKYNALALVPAVAAALLWPWWRRAESLRRGLLRVAVAATLFALIVAPWLIRNVVVAGTPLPTRMARVTTVATERYTLFDWRPLELLRTPFALAEVVRPGETLPYREHQALTAADTSLWTKTWALWWHDALYYLPQPPPAWTAARYAASLPVCLTALLGVAVGWRALLRRGRPGPAPPGAASGPGSHPGPDPRGPRAARATPMSGAGGVDGGREAAGSIVAAAAAAARETPPTAPATAPAVPGTAPAPARPSPPGAASHVAPLVLVAALLALYFAFVARYPWVRLGHARAAFLLPLTGPFALGWGLGWLALTAGRPRWTRALLGGALAVLVALSLAYEAFLLA